MKKWLITAAVCGILALTAFAQVNNWPKQALIFVQGLGSAAPYAFIALYILACIFFFPRSLLSIGAGVLFGVWPGVPIVSIAGTIGSSCAFLIGRYLARDWAARQMEKHPRLRSLDEVVARDGWKLVLLIRLSPLFPFNFLNYGFSLTRIPFIHFFLASWAGTLPCITFYVYLGSLAGDLASLGRSTPRPQELWQWLFYGAALLITVWVTIYATRMVQRAFTPQTPSGKPSM